MVSGIGDNIKRGFIAICVLVAIVGVVGGGVIVFVAIHLAK